ncbi:multidrug effflux MFS transporter [Rhodoferax sp. GW822-FHT02A01]|uniref:multidrug effflux MFS transporter n=1 Tax=Rhodoferax sp. GW822-FHT02A01 TaxID=3141537 RepID=UPI00315D3ABC
MQPIAMTDTPAHNRMSTAMVVLTLSMLLGLQPITTDLYLPALPGLTQDLGASMAQAQLTLSALLLAFGASQLVWGPVSDRFGRRPVLLVGLLAYLVASIACALVSTMEQLIYWRTLQGIAMGAAVMCARAIVRDLYAPAQGATAMSKGLSGLGVLACIAAPLGGVLTALWGWHAALSALAAFGALALVLIALRFEETVPQKNPRALEWRTLLRTWLHILRNPEFVAFSALSLCSYGGLFTFLAASSFVYIKVLGFTTTQYGLTMFLNSFIYLVGTFACRRMVRHLGVRRTVAWAGLASLACGVGMPLLAWLGFRAGWAIMLPMSAFIFGHGIHQPCGQSGAVGPFPQAAGAASAMNGFLMMLAAFFTGQWLGTHMDGSVLPLAWGMGFWSVLLVLSAWTLVQRYGEN